jgi:hypothetical protein
MATIIVPLYGLMKKRIYAPLKLSEIEKAQRLTFSSISKIGSYIIAVDAIRKKLLYFKNMQHTKSCAVIDLNYITECSIRKEYSRIGAGELSKKKLSDFLRSLYMVLRFKKQSGLVSLPLFETGTDYNINIEDLEGNVKACEIVISKLLPPQIKERA